MDHIVVDVEIMNPVEECTKGWESTEEMGVAIACVWEFQSQRMRIYGERDVEDLRERLLCADRISGFNIWKFDFPVIFGLPGHERVVQLAPKCDDLLRRIWQALALNPDEFTPAHRGWNLNAVAGNTIGARKIGYGGDAPKWYRQGQIAKVANYCADDVAIERDLTTFVDQYGYVLGPNGGRLDIPKWTGIA